MELNNALKDLSNRITQLKEHSTTEESTKHAFVLPFINALGYDTFNPVEVMPEYTADIGLKKGEKVDYCIFQNEQPILIVECKHWKEDLSHHNSQLFRYFHATKTRFAVLTNGIEYRFYTDLEEVNKMDEKPFLEFSITHLKENVIHEISKFHKSNFDIDKIVNNASSLKYTKEIRKIIHQELQSPSYDFVRLFAGRVYSGRLTERVMDEFTELIHKAFNQTISNNVNDRLNAALDKEAEKQQEEETLEGQDVSKIITTEEEEEGFRIIVAILRRKIAVNRIFPRDTQSYFGILLDNNNRKPLCRLHFNGSKKYLGFFDEKKRETKVQLTQLEDIYLHEKLLLQTADYYTE